jgi:DNA-binding response OmpR family regulator
MDLMTKKILLADDEDDIREDLALFLEYSDYEVLQAKDGHDAYACYLDNALDLIITDIEMPKVNGLELVECIREKDKKIPILIMSGYSDKDKLLRAIKLNLVDYMIKPFTRQSILATIRAIFSDKEKNDETFTVKGHSFSFISNHLSYDNQEYSLTTKQAKVIKLFLKNVNVVLSPVDIYYHLYPNYDKEYSNASIRNIIKRLRTIFPEDAIESVYAEGYKFNTHKLK